MSQVAEREAQQREVERLSVEKARRVKEEEQARRLKEEEERLNEEHKRMAAEEVIFPESHTIFNHVLLKSSSCSHRMSLSRHPRIH